MTYDTRYLDLLDFWTSGLLGSLPSYTVLPKGSIEWCYVTESACILHAALGGGPRIELW